MQLTSQTLLEVTRLLNEQHGEIYTDNKDVWNNYLNVTNFEQLCERIYNETYDENSLEQIKSHIHDLYKQKKQRKIDWTRRYKAKLKTNKTLTETEKVLLIEDVKRWAADTDIPLYATECFFQKRMPFQVAAYRMDIELYMGLMLLDLDKILVTQLAKQVEDKIETTHALAPDAISDSKDIIIPEISSLENIQAGYLIRPEVLTNYPIFGIKKTKLELTLNGANAYNDYIYEDNFVITTLIENIEDKMKQCSYITLKDGLTTLDQTDAAIVDYIFDQIVVAKLLESDGRIVINPMDVLRAVYKTENGDYYKEVIRRIEQLHCYRMQGKVINTDGSSVTFSFSFFSDYIYHKQKRNSTISLVFGSTLKQAYIKAATLNAATLCISPEQKKQLMYSNARAVIYPLSKVRVTMGIEHIKNNGDRTQGYHRFFSLGYFKGVVRLTDKKNYKNMETIEKALNQLVDAKCIIERVEKVKSGFDIYFLPLSEEEIKLLGVDQSIGLPDNSIIDTTIISEQ